MFKTSIFWHLKETHLNISVTKIQLIKIYFVKLNPYKQFFIQK